MTSQHMTSQQQDLFEYATRLGDSALILGQRLSEWCGHSPELELDMAITNLSLDLIGQARLLLALAGEIEGAGRDEDQLAFLRDALDFRCLLLVEQPNGDWAQTIARQFFFSAFQQLQFQALSQSADARLAAIATKALPEIAYHVRFAADWVVRLGDGTEESHRRMAAAIDNLWRFTDEMFLPDAVEERLTAAGIAPDATALKAGWLAAVTATLGEAGIAVPAPHRPVVGSRVGHHSEHLGHVLSEMQFMQRAYPNAEW